MNMDDPVIRALDPHVRSGALSPERARQICADIRDAGGPATEPVPDRRDSLLLGLVAVAVGIMLASALVASVGRSAYEPAGFSWKTFLIEAGGVAVLGAAAALLALRGGARAASSAGVLLAGALWLMAQTVLDAGDDSGMLYVSGGLLLIAGVAAYAWLRRPVLALLAAIGAGQLFGNLLSDAYGSPGSFDSGRVLLIGVMAALFGVAVAGAGWRTKAHRMLLMAGALVAYVSLAAVTLVLAVIGVAVVGLSDYGDPLGTGSGIKTDSTLACVLGLIATAGVLTVHLLRPWGALPPLVLAGAATFTALLPLARGFTHPVVWGAVLAVVATLALAATLWQLTDVRATLMPDRSRPTN